MKPWNSSNPLGGSAAVVALAVMTLVCLGLGTAMIWMFSDSGTQAPGAERRKATLRDLEHRVEQGRAPAVLVEEASPANGANELPSEAEVEAEPASASARAADDPGETLDGDFFGSFQALRAAETDEERLAVAAAMVKNDNPMLQMAAIQTLVELDPEAAAKAVQNMVENLGKDDRMAGMVARSVRLLGEADGAVNVELYEMSRSPHQSVQLAAAKALEEQGDPTVMQSHVAAIAPNLASNDPETVIDAIDGLGQTRSTMASGHLLPLLGDGDSEVRLRTLDALRRTGDDSLIPEVKALLNDPVASVRDRAANLIEDLRDGDNRDRGFRGRFRFAR